MREKLRELSRFQKKILIAGADLTALWLCLLLAYLLRLNSLIDFDPFTSHITIFALAPLTSVLACRHFGLYRTVTRFTGLETQITIIRSMLAGVAVLMIALYLLPNEPRVPRSIPILYFVFGVFALVITRYLAGSWLQGNSLTFLASRFVGKNSGSARKGIPIAVYGAGASGRQVCAAITKSYKYNPVAYIDDDPNKQGTRMDGLEVHPPSTIAKLIKKNKIEKILLAIPSATVKRRKTIIDELSTYQLHIIAIPGLEEIADGKVSLEEIREVSVEEILGRTPVAAQQELLTPHIKDKNVLVTGAGGSIGSELCRQIIKQEPASLILFENSEVNLYKIHTEIENTCANVCSKTIVYPVLGSVARPATIGPVIEHFKIHTLYHAAAYKHVPMVEYNTGAAFANNILGTLYTAEAAILGGVEKFVLVSTDKAVRPTNFMGATKRMAELILQALSNESSVRLTEPYRVNMPSDASLINRTKFTMVRFGNVLESSGSVVPKFREQISRGGPLTVTHPDIIRYFMTIPEAAQLVIQAGTMGNKGDVFLLDMGEPIKIADLARKMISLYGLQVRDEENPDGDIDIEYSGLRPGEKLYEELLIGNNSSSTNHSQIFKADEASLSWPEVKQQLESIRAAFHHNNYQKVRDILLSIEQLGYQPSDDISDWYHSNTETNDQAEVNAKRVS